MKIIQRTQKLQQKGNTLYESVPGGARKVRCTRCNTNYAVEVKDASGKEILQCPCGAKFSSIRM